MTKKLEDLPPELIDEVIFRSSLPALLQLRLVSKKLKTLVDSSIRFPDVLEDIQINLHSSTIEAFLDSAPLLPFTNFYIDNRAKDDTPVDFTGSPHVKQFMDSFCSPIRKLRVHSISSHALDSEQVFFQFLPNLRDLHIISLQAPPVPKTPDAEDAPDLPDVKLPFSGVNRVLKRLTVDQETNSGDYLIQWIQNCPSLQFIQIPKSLGKPIGTSSYPTEQPTEEPGETTPWILRLGAQGHLQHLQTLDMNNQKIQMTLCTPQDIQFFIKILTDQQIRLENVPPAFLRDIRDQFPPETLAQLKQRIVTCPESSQDLKDGFPNLQTLHFSTCWEPTEYFSWTTDSKSNPNPLPALRKISALINGPTITSHKFHDDFLQWLFCPPLPRTNVTELNVSVDKYETTLRFTPEHLDLGFPNLTRLYLEIHLSSYIEAEEFIMVISRKKLLQELTIHFPWGISDAVLIAKTPQGTYPAFQGLKDLRKLTLSWSGCGRGTMIDREDGVYDLWSKLSLTHLANLGRRVTEEGVAKIMAGPFGQSILWPRISLRDEPGITPTECPERDAFENRLAKGLTSITTFEQFKETQEAEAGKPFPFRKVGFFSNKSLSSVPHGSFVSHTVCFESRLDGSSSLDLRNQLQ